MAEDKTEKPADKKDWLASHIQHLSELKAPSDTQKLLLLLAAKNRTQAEERTFAAIVKSEKALERAKKAQTEVASLLATEAAAERKARTHKMIQLGLLFSYAELDESPRELLMGLLLMGAKTDELNRQKLSQIGADFLAKKEPKKEKSAAASAPAPQPAPAPAAAPRPAPAPAAALTAPEKTFLKTSFVDKEAVKALGAVFDYDLKKWFVPPGVDLTPFKKWIV